MRTCVHRERLDLDGRFLLRERQRFQEPRSSVPRRWLAVLGFGAGVGGVAGCVLCCARMAGAAAPEAAITAAKFRRVRRVGLAWSFIGPPGGNAYIMARRFGILSWDHDVHYYVRVGQAIVVCRLSCTVRLAGHAKRWPAPRLPHSLSELRWHPLLHHRVSVAALRQDLPQRPPDWLPFDRETGPG